LVLPTRVGLSRGRLVDCRPLVARRLVAMVFGGVLVGLARVVTGQYRGLLVRGRCPAMSLTGVDMALRRGMVRLFGALQRFSGPFMRVLHGLLGDRQTVGQVGAPLLQLLGTRPGPVAAGGVVGQGPSGHG